MSEMSTNFKVALAGIIGLGAGVVVTKVVDNQLGKTRPQGSSQVLQNKFEPADVTVNRPQFSDAGFTPSHNSTLPEYRVGFGTNFNSAQTVIIPPSSVQHVDGNIILTIPDLGLSRFTGDKKETPSTQAYYGVSKLRADDDILPARALEGDSSAR